jgi:hypothetical protein
MVRFSHIAQEGSFREFVRLEGDSDIINTDLCRDGSDDSGGLLAHVSNSPTEPQGCAQGTGRPVAGVAGMMPHGVAQIVTVQ